MKIAMVSEHASPLASPGGVDAGGQNVHVASLSAALAARGHEVVVYTRRDDAALPGRVRMCPGVAVEHILAGPAEPLTKDELLPFIPAFAARLGRHWQLRPPDVAHAHFWMSGLAALTAGAAAGVPVLQTFHALGTVKQRWQAGADTSPAQRISVERRLARDVDRIVATCRDEAAELVAMGAAPMDLDIVPCGVDLGLFRPTRSPAAARIVTVSRLVPRKGLDTVVRALALLPGVELVIAGGPDPDELAADPEARRLTALAAELGLTDRVRLLGRVPRPELPALIGSAQVAVSVPWYEPFGIAPLEAMACGVPVVASAVGGHLDTVVPNATGLLVPPRDPVALATALDSLLGHPRYRERLGAAARRRAEQRYGWSAVAAQTERCYAEVHSAARAAVGRPVPVAP